jgi:hypothetical protein
MFKPPFFDVEATDRKQRKQLKVQTYAQACE